MTARALAEEVKKAAAKAAAQAKVDLALANAKLDDAEKKENAVEAINIILGVYYHLSPSLPYQADMHKHFKTVSEKFHVSLNTTQLIETKRQWVQFNQNGGEFVAPNVAGRKPVLTPMEERALAVWIAQHADVNKALSPTEIGVAAVDIFNRRGGSTKFVAAKKWLKDFQQRRSKLVDRLQRFIVVSARPIDSQRAAVTTTQIA